MVLEGLQERAQRKREIHVSQSNLLKLKDSLKAHHESNQRLDSSLDPSIGGLWSLLELFPLLSPNLSFVFHLPFLSAQHRNTTPVQEVRVRPFYSLDLKLYKYLLYIQEGIFSTTQTGFCTNKTRHLLLMPPRCHQMCHSAHLSWSLSSLIMLGDIYCDCTKMLQLPLYPTWVESILIDLSIKCLWT